MLESQIKAAKDFFNKYERRISLAFLVSGFIFDNLTLQRVDFLLDNLVLLVYLIIVAGSIAVINRGIKYASFIAPYAMQFAIGGLFSGYIVFYFRSASFSISWPFLLMLLVFFIGNEFFRKHYEVLAFRLSIFFIAVFSYLIFSLPVLFHRMGADVFILSGSLSLAAAAGLVYLMKKFFPQHVAGHYPYIITAIGTIYVIFNVFYFTNIIPPIPLALKDAGIYHSILRTSGGYAVLAEKRTWYDIFGRNKIRLMPGEPAYAYSSVFAPTNLESEIFHRWSYYNEAENQWVDAGRIGFPITGGSNEGYRGYSVKSAIFPGYWRVDVVTDRDQVIGRVKFWVIETQSPIVLESKIL